MRHLSLYIILLSFSHFLLGKAIGESPLVPALYVFGDSFFDNGNNNWLPTLARANYPPYGLNFPKGPTGRFTNGKTVADFIADYLGLPYPPPYVKPLRLKSMTGYNYASGSCGILPDTGRVIGLCLNLDDQIKRFQSTVKTSLATSFKNQTQLSQHLAKSIFIFSTGNNDYINTYFSSLSGASKRYNPQEFAQLLVDTLSQKLQSLYKLGARKVVIFELGPIGCIPTIRKRSHLKSGQQCDESKNKIVSIFNDKLALMLQNLTTTLQDSNFILGRVHSLGYDAIINPQDYGLNDSTNPCCITWGNGTLSCIPELKPCSSPDKHFFWDGYHLTEPICSIVATRCIHDSSVCAPMSIQMLAQL